MKKLLKHELIYIPATEISQQTTVKEEPSESENTPAIIKLSARLAQ
jgi:hypothetical protein